MFKYNYNKSDQTRYNNVAPPDNINQRQNRTDVNQIPVQKYGRQQLSNTKRIMQDEDDYFNDDDDQIQNVEELDQTNSGNSDDEEDPLDAFMANINEQVKTGSSKSKPIASTTKTNSKQLPSKHELKGVRDDIDGEDIEESYYKYMEENPTAGLFPGSAEEEEEDQIIDYDQDGNPIYKKTKYIDPLPAIDHTQIDYQPFSKNFYIEHEEIAGISNNKVKDLRLKLNVRVMGPQPPRPVSSFAHFNFDEQLMKIIRKCEYTQPTPIQAQGIPVVLSGRDLIAIAKTGSGKTAAFLWPMLVHIMDQRDIGPGDGPIGLILAPTRELSQQIYSEAKKFGKAYNIRAVCCYGGGSKWEMQKDLEAGAEIVIATPGRLIDLVKCKSTNLERVTMLVLDEADRMFAMGFEAQVRSICDHCRPDKQTLMYSATFKKRIERLTRDVLVDPIKIIQGELGEANEDICQKVIVLPSSGNKWDWLTSNLTELESSGSVLIFVTQKSNAEELANNLRARDYTLEVIHGDFDQQSRNKVITKFKKKEINILIATDIAARGLDIPHIRTVINYDVARDIDTHTHRIGRTGRAGVEGVAYTLITEKDKEFAGHIVRNLEGANQEVPDDLMKLALQSQWFKKARYKDSKAKKLNFKTGLGYKPGLGFESEDDKSNSVDGSTSKNMTAQSSSNQYSNSSSKASYNYRSMPNSQQSSSSSKISAANRLEAMKSSYSAQFKSAFRAASDSTPSIGSFNKYNTPSDRPTIVANTNAGSSSVHNDETLSSNFEKPKKKSRWQ